MDKLDEQSDKTPINRCITRVGRGNRPTQNAALGGITGGLQDGISEKKTLNSLLRQKTKACASHVVLNRLQTIQKSLTN